MPDSFVEFIRRKYAAGAGMNERQMKAVEDWAAGPMSGIESRQTMGGNWGSDSGYRGSTSARGGNAAAGGTSGSSSGGSTRSGIGSDYAAGGGNYPTSGFSGVNRTPTTPAPGAGALSDPKRYSEGTGKFPLGRKPGSEESGFYTSAAGSTAGTHGSVAHGAMGGGAVPVEAARPLRSAAPAGGGAGYGPYGGSGTGSRTARNFSGSGFGGFDSTSSRIMSDLRSDYNLTREQAAGVVGNLAHESGGFTTYQEGKPLSGRGGAGWAQWTGDRRNEFESWAKENNLDTRSYAANYGFLKHELNSGYKGTIASLRKTQTPEQAMYAFEQGFEKAGVKHYGSRLKYANAAFSGAPYSSGKIKPGGTADIRTLQASLNERGANIIVDGIMGSQTRKAMKQYQMGGPAYGTTLPGARALSENIGTHGPASASPRTGMMSVPTRERGGGGYAGSAYAGGGSRGSAGGGGQYGGGYGGGGGFGGGGTYGGSGGGNINQGVGGAYRNR